MCVALLAKYDRKTGAIKTIREHMRESAAVAENLYDDWLPRGVLRQLPQREVCVFLVAAHDVGKASPAFQTHIEGKGKNTPRHWIISFEILRRAGFDRSLCAVVGSHHGKPPEEEQTSKIKNGGFEDLCGFDTAQYLSAQRELLVFAEELAQLDRTRIEPLTRQQQMLMTGLLILSDWIASATGQGESIEALPPRRSGGDACGDIYAERFRIDTPRPVQQAVLDIFRETNAPGLMIIEAPMGEGKTEAALAATELMAERSGRGGLFFALPTQATSNAMFSRVLDWTQRFRLEEPRTIDLLHGKKLANDQYLQINVYGEGDTPVAVHSWLRGRKKAILSDFVIGTVDHALMAALKQKHVMLRHLGLSGKVVVIDECHAYDAYMDVYLARTLEWLGAYRTPVVILSATLTAEKRGELISAYLGKKESRMLSVAYPLITYTDGNEIRERSVPASGRRVEVAVRIVGDDDELFARLDGLLCGGGCAGVIVNTVGRAQALYGALKARFPNTPALLLHSRFTAEDRQAREKELPALLGKPGPSNARPERLIVVGTQVLEQSLDIDFDLLVCELCPMDLLIQRLGRLHRHARRRPPALKGAQCLILKSDEGSEAVYGAYLLGRTRALLPETIALPGDIAPLVNAAYDGSDGAGKEAHDKRIGEKRSRAGAFLLGRPGSGLIVDLLNVVVSDTDRRGEAAVRDGTDALEVALIGPNENGASLGTVQRMMRSIRLPPLFDKMICRAIAELEHVCPNREGDLFLRLDNNGEADLCGYRLRYDKEKGLVINEREK